MRRLHREKSQPASLPDQHEGPVLREAVKPVDLHVQPGGPRLGELLVEANLATHEQVVAALEAAMRGSGTSLGSQLIANGSITERDLAQMLGRQQDLDVVDLRQIIPDPAATTLMTGSMARALNAIPLSADTDTLVVAVADPSPTIVQSLREVVGRPVTIKIATQSDVTMAIGNSYRALASIDSQAGALHVLVNNAGIISRHNIQGMPTAVWRRVLDINLTGAFLGMRLTAPLIARSGGGAMVNISSVAGLAAHPDPAYVASKWGLRGLTKTAAVEFAASGIRVNSVHPAMIMTELQHSAPPGYAEASNQAIPLGRAAEAEEVAAAVLFLACDESSFVTGTELVVDGGLIAGGVMRMRAHLQQQFAAGRGA